MRIVLLTHYYPPEVGAPQARLAALAELLAARGARVTVHTGFPNYPDGQLISPYRNRPLLVEGQDGIRVVRSAVWPAPNRGFARRLLNHLSFAASALVTSAAAGPADVVIAETPPLFTAAAARLYARIKRARLIVNVADRWPASAVELGMLRSPVAIRPAEWLERFSYSRAAALTTPTGGLADALANVDGAPARVVRIPPTVDLERFRPSPAPRREGPLKVLYAGTLGLAQGIGTLVEAAELAGPDVVQVTIAGGGAEEPELREHVARRGLANVRMLGTVAHEVVPALMEQAETIAVLLRDRPIFEAAIPTKLLEAMAAQRAVVLAARGEAAALVESGGAGLVVPPGDPAALAHAFKRLRDDDNELLASLGAAGRALAEARFGRERVAAEWRRLLEEICPEAGWGAACA